MGLVSILILMLMLVKHGLEFVHSLVMLLGLFTSKFILIEVRLNVTGPPIPVVLGWVFPH